MYTVCKDFKFDAKLYSSLAAVSYSVELTQRMWDSKKVWKNVRIFCKPAYWNVP